MIGSRFIPRTAIEKLSNVLNQVYVFRSEQQKLLHPTSNRRPYVLKIEYYYQKRKYILTH